MANERRIYANLVGGIVTDNPLASGATTLNSDGLAAMPAVGTNEHMIIVFDPDGLTGAPYAKRVTAHTASATSCTIEATAYTTDGLGSARDIPQDTPWVAPMLAENVSRYAVRKSADESVNNSTTLQNDDELWFPIGVSEIWVATFHLFLSSVADGADIKFDTTAPSGATGRQGLHGAAIASTATESDLKNQSIAIGTALSVGIPAAGTNDSFAIFSVAVENSTTAGLVRLQWAQASAVASNTTVKEGSFMIAEKVF